MPCGSLGVWVRVKVHVDAVSANDIQRVSRLAIALFCAMSSQSVCARDGSASEVFFVSLGRERGLAKHSLHLDSKAKLAPPSSAEHSTK